MYFAAVEFFGVLKSGTRLLTASWRRCVAPRQVYGGATTLSLCNQTDFEGAKGALVVIDGCETDTSGTA